MVTGMVTGMVLTLRFLAAASPGGPDALFLPLVFLHAIAALAGFGSIGFAGTYASRAAQLPATWGAGGEARSGAAPPEMAPPEMAPLAQAGSGTLPVEAAPVEAAPVEAAPVEAAPVEAAPVEEGPVEEAPVEEGPVEEGPPVQGAAWPLSVGALAAEGALDGAGGPAAVDPETEEIMRYFQRPARFWKAVLAVPVLGLLALVADPSEGGLDQVWALGAFLVWIGAVLVVVSIVVPGLTQMKLMLTRPAGPSGFPAIDGPERVRLARAGTLASRGAAACDVLFFVALALMIWRP
jgi:hypothetical protein